MEYQITIQIIKIIRNNFEVKITNENSLCELREN